MKKLEASGGGIHTLAHGTREERVRKDWMALVMECWSRQRPPRHHCGHFRTVRSVIMMGPLSLGENGLIPAEVSAEFASRGAIICLLEKLANILALLVFHKDLRSPFLAFVDDTAAQHALTKGYATPAGRCCHR